jgi:RNA polymerase sigma-70 factor (ECF subfamily)
MGRDFAALYRETLTPLRRYLARILGCRSEAQDVAHDAYLRLYTVMDGREIEQPAPFLYTTARRLALNRLRRRRQGAIQEATGNVIEMTLASDPSVEDLVAARQEWAQVEAVIEGLPAGCRQVLRLSKVEHLTHREIAERLGTAVSTVEKQHARALRLIREALEELRSQCSHEPERRDASGR